MSLSLVYVSLIFHKHSMSLTCNIWQMFLFFAACVCLVRCRLSLYWCYSHVVCWRLSYWCVAVQHSNSNKFQTTLWFSAYMSTISRQSCSNLSHTLADDCGWKSKCCSGEVVWLIMKKYLSSCKEKILCSLMRSPVRISESCTSSQPLVQRVAWGHVKSHSTQTVTSLNKREVATHFN